MTTAFEDVTEGPARPTLPAIITAARAGGLNHAWAMFTGGGYDGLDDPSALAVKGRLLKDRALRLASDARKPAFAQAANAYAQADALSRQPYTTINTATLRLLSGDREGAVALARDLIAWLDRDSEVRETPYYIAATRAEAFLICGDRATAEILLRMAIGYDPDGWLDHASTLRQLQLIVDATGADGAWLDAFRPPHSVYYAGHLGVASEASPGVRAQAAAFLERQRVGFGYGALAAGSDLVIAEALLERGAELHVVLPTQADAFAAQSVTPYGADWLARYWKCIDAAHSIRTLTHVTGAYEPLATQLAGDVAMGSAILNARQLETDAAQLLIIDDGEGPYGSGAGTARDAERWKANGLRQELIICPRTAPVVPSGKKTEREGRADRRLMAMLHISFDGLDGLDEGVFADAVDRLLIPFRAAAALIVAQPDTSLSTGNDWIAGFASPGAAWDFARALTAIPEGELPLRIGGHYALVHSLESPAALVGPGMAVLEAIAASAIPGVPTVSESLASSLFVSCGPELHPEWVGEAAGMRLFTLSEAAG